MTYLIGIAFLFFISLLIALPLQFLIKNMFYAVVSSTIAATAF